MTKIAKVCQNCGSESVMAHAWAVWSVEEQRWELGTVFNHEHCADCDGETSIVDRPPVVDGFVRG